MSPLHEASALTVATPSFRSGSSIGTGSPTLLNPELELLDVPHSVKFAPLPHIDPGRKRCMVPLGVSGRARRKRVIQQEASWRTDLDAPENMDTEDPLATFAKFLKKTGKTLWQRVRKSSRAEAVLQDVSCPTEPVMDITSTALGEEVGGEYKRGRASWSAGKRRSRSLDEAKRRSTSDLRVM